MRPRTFQLRPLLERDERTLARLSPRITPIRLAALAVAAGAVAWASYLGYESWRYEAEFERRLARGRRRVVRAGARPPGPALGARRPGRDEVEYTLGGCEAMLGHVDAALGAWSRVPDDLAVRRPRGARPAPGSRSNTAGSPRAEASLERVVGRAGPSRRRGGEAGRPARPLPRPGPADHRPDRAPMGVQRQPARAAAHALDARDPAVPRRGRRRGPRADGAGVPRRPARLARQRRAWRSGPGASARPTPGCRVARHGGRRTPTSAELA